jgi:Zn-finger nucleic acid-binding protein
MKCPTCLDATLVMSERQGVEIDYCPTCRGVWLDRGELDKLIERSIGNNPAISTPTVPTAPAAPSAPMHRRDDSDEHERYQIRYDKYGRPYKKSKTKSILGEIFDF